MIKLLELLIDNDIFFLLLHFLFVYYYTLSTCFIYY